MARKTCSPASVPMNESAEVSVRQIDNGFIVRKSTYGGKGGYQSTEVYSKEKPKIELEVGPEEKSRPRKSAPSTLASAIKHLK